MRESGLTEGATQAFGSGYLENWPQRALEHVWYPYAQMQELDPPFPVRGAEGCRIHLADGRELIDGTSSWWSACHGYRHPYIQTAVQQQLETLPHVMLGGLTHEPVVTLAERLAAWTPGDLNHTMFTDSGSVAVEVALKIAHQFWANRGQHKRQLLVSFENGYHGDTSGCMAVSDTYRTLRSTFSGLVTEHATVPLPESTGPSELEALLERQGDEIAAVIVEPLVQGAGGMRVHSPEVLKRVHDLCQGADTLLIADEVATGFGRTGSLFACEQASITPDILCLSKALTGGTMALAATVATRRVFQTFYGPDERTAFMHGPTFTGNPLACTAANASLDLFAQEPRLEQVAAIEEQLHAELGPCREIPGVADVRVKGAMGALQVAHHRYKDWMRYRFVEEGVWIRPLGDTVYITPPLVIDSAELSHLTTAMRRVVAEAFG